MKNYPLFKWFRNISITKKLYFVVGIMVLIITAELLVFMFAMNSLSAIRAFTRAEGTWSKAQKNAIYNLDQYGHHHDKQNYYDEKHYLSFQNYMKVLNGDQKARLEIIKKNPNREIAKQGLIEGLNHPNDVDRMITLFTRYRNFSFIHDATLIWTKADSLSAELMLIGEKLHAEINNSPTQEKIDAIISEIYPMNIELTQVEDDFSDTLGDGAQWMTSLILKLFLSINLIVGIGGILYATSLSRSILKELDELNKAASRVTKGDFSTKAKVYSQNEIGFVATGFNLMTEQLEKQINQIKHSEEEAKQSEAQFRQLFENTTELIHNIHIADRKILYVNPAWLKTLEYTDEEAKNLFVQNIIHPDFLAQFNLLFQKLTQGENVDFLEGEFISKSGKKIFIEGSIVCYLKDGVPLSTLGIFRNVTERKKAEEKQAMLAAIVDFSDDAIISTLLDGTITTWNKGAERLLGYTGQEIIGKSIFVISPPHLGKEDPELLEKIKQGNLIDHYETQRIKKDGTIIPVAISLSPIKNASGHITGISKMAHDISDRKKAEEQLRLIVASSPNALLLIDKEGIILLVNPQTEKLFGYSSSEMLGQKIEILIPERFRQKHPDQRNEFFTRPNTKHLKGRPEIFGLTKSGSEVPLEIGLNPISTTQGIQVLATIVDITERKKAAGELQQTTEFLNAILENIPDMIFVKDAKELRFLRFNAAGEELLGFKKQEMLGKNDYDFFPKEQADFFTSKDKTVLKEGKMLDIPEELIATKYKGNRILETKKIPIFDKNGEAIYLLGISHDITERKKGEEELKQTNDFLNAVLDNIPTIIFVKDAKELKYIRINKAVENLFGYAKEEVIGKNDYELFPKQEADFFVANDKKLLESGKLVEIEEEQIHTKNKEVRILENKIVLINDSSGKPKYLLGLANDITERKNVLEELKQKSEELVRSNTELEQFAYVASHDLQEPLRMVTSYLQLLENRYKDKLDKDANEFIAFAVDGSTRMKTLILSLLEYSRVNRVKPFEEIDVNLLLKDVLKNISTSIKESNAIIKIDELPKIKGDPILINQLFQNLIENGIKFRETRNPEITITGKKQNNEYLFSVKDNGIGIKKEYISKLFVIFQRLNSKEKYPGTGIGLAICKKIVERHGGKIWIESEENKGSTFYFTIKEI